MFPARREGAALVSPNPKRLPVQESDYACPNYPGYSLELPRVPFHRSGKPARGGMLKFQLMGTRSFARPGVQL